MADHDPITADDIAARDDLDDWRVVDGVLRAAYTVGSFGSGGRLVAAIAAAADEADHHPDLTLSYPGTVGISLVTHAAGGLTTADAELAARISTLAAGEGATAEEV